MTRYRLNIFVEPEHAKRLAELGAMKGVSKSAIVGTALASFLSPEDAHRREAAIARRLDRLSGQFERLERDQAILIETLALFVRYYLSMAASVPEEHQDAVRAAGRARFEQFVTQVARKLHGGRGFAHEVHDELRASTTLTDDIDAARDAGAAT